MKSWLNKYKYHLGIFATLILVAIVYRTSFTSRFFQDDKLNLELAASHNFFAVIPGANHFRPVSVQGFYFLGETLFGYDPTGYHLLEFGIFALTLFLVFESAKIIVGDKNRSLLITFLYAVNISLFANFFWIANSQFVIGSFLFFLCFWLFYHKKFSWLAIPMFIIGLASNEQILSLIFVLPVISHVFKKPFPKNTYFWLCGLCLAWVGLRTLVFKLPENSQYAVDPNPITAIKTFRWYILRALNLPEGVQFSVDRLFTGAFILLLLTLIKTKLNWKLIGAGAFWFAATLGIFIFLPNHMSAHYLSVALFGSSLIISELSSKKKVILATSLILYLFLTVRGLDFLAKTHWIILKNTGPIGQF